VKIKPFERNTDSSKKHITDRLFERGVSQDDRMAVLRQLVELGKLFGARRVDAPDPACRWWMPLVNEWHMAGFANQGNTLGSPAEIPMTDATLVVNPVLDRLDRRNWRMRLNRIRPEDAKRIVDALLGSPASRLMDDILRSDEQGSVEVARRAQEALASRDQNQCIVTLADVGEELRLNRRLFNQLADAALTGFGSEPITTTE